MELKTQINTNTLVVGDFNTLFSLIQIDHLVEKKNIDLKIKDILQQIDLKISTK